MITLFGTIGTLAIGVGVIAILVQVWRINRDVWHDDL